MTISTLPDENEQSLIEFARARGMIAMRHPDTDQLYAFDKRSAPEWAEGRMNLAYVEPEASLPSKDALDEMTRAKWAKIQAEKQP